MAAVAVPILWIAFSERAPQRWLVLALLFVIALLFVLHDRAAPKEARWTHRYLAGQSLLVTTLEWVDPANFAAVVLFFMLSAQAATYFPWRVSLRWVAFFVLITAALMALRGGLETLLTLPIYAGGYFFFAAFAHQTRQAEQAREESQRLLAELQAAHRQLQAYAEQVEELAVARERNRLAREMHDTLGHRLTVAAVQLEGAERLIPTRPGTGPTDGAHCAGTGAVGLAGAPPDGGGPAHPAGSRPALAEGAHPPGRGVREGHRPARALRPAGARAAPAPGCAGHPLPRRPGSADQRPAPRPGPASVAHPAGGRPQRHPGGPG
ncbi:MAG: histidine kinase [Ardenticatenia bacterium]|nr:histidine kinase [Ardenticatenia bacterium]